LAFDTVPFIINIKKKFKTRKKEVGDVEIGVFGERVRVG
jgi:hypothetical protein